MSEDNFDSMNLNERLSPVQKQTKRKHSFPSTFHSASLLEINTNINTRRRLSNVSEVVSRKLSYTMGWKTTQISSQDIITQGKYLCSQYIKRRLKRCGINNKKLGLPRTRSTLGTSSLLIVREVLPTLIILGDELERMHPRIYTGIVRQLCRSPSADFPPSETVTFLISVVARELFKIEITWGKIISLFNVAGGFAGDCIRKRHAEYMPKVLEAVSDIIEEELVPWINENGGWAGINSHVHQQNLEFHPLEWTTHVVGYVFLLFIVIIISRFFGNYILPLINMSQK